MNSDNTKIKIVKIIGVILFATIYLSAQTKLTPHKIVLSDGNTFNLNLPSDFEVIPAAEGLRRVRFFSKAPDERIFVTDMFNLSDNEKGKVYILDEFDTQTGKFGKVSEYMSGLKNPNSVAFYTDGNGQDWFYLAETDKLTRRKFTKNEQKPTDTKPQTLATFPDYGLSYKYGGWHLTRTIALGGNGKLYVSVGSSCNSCIEKENVRATILEMNPDGSNQRIYASGLRNAVGLLWMGNYLWATNQGSDHLGKRKPDETFNAVKDGADYGWAQCYQSNGKVYRDSTIKGGNCRGVSRSYAYFPPHSSALGFDYFDSETESELLKDSFLVALHGSTDKTVGSGYKLVIMRKGEKLQDFLTGFLQGNNVHGRPCDVYKLTPDSFLVSDDHTGVVYFIRKKPDIAKLIRFLEFFKSFIQKYS